MWAIDADIARAGYGAEVVRGARLRVREGELALVVGPSGSGKTTLLLAIAGVLGDLLGGFAEGSSRIGGEEMLGGGWRASFPRLAGFVLQDPDRQIAMPTPLDEVAFGLENLGLAEGEARRRAERALAEFGLSGKAGAHVEELSSGEKRRLNLACAVAHDPAAVLMDEPTAFLDPWGIKAVREFAERAKSEGRALLVAEHKALYFWDLADSAYGLERGSLGPWRQGPGRREIGGGGRGAGPGGLALRARGLAVGYGRPLLRVDELEVRRGEVLAVVGPNGSGKTTLLKALAGLRRPLEGEVEAPAGRPFYVPQNPDLIFLKRTVREELRDSARSVPLGLLESLLPWRDIGGRNPLHLSHGQRRWLSILVAYGYSRGVLLLDEPTTGLDDSLYRQLAGLISRLRGAGAAVVVATHDPRVLADLADRAVSVEGGRLVEAEPRELAARLYEEAGVGVA